MRHPEDLPKLGLVDILLKIREALYFDDANDEWCRNIVMSGSDATRGEALRAVDVVMAEAGLLPHHAPSPRCRCPFCEAECADNRDPAPKCVPAS